MTAPSETAVIARIKDILEGRGADGALGADAQARAIPAKFFRLTNLDPSSPALAGSLVDRGVLVAFDTRNDRIPRNVHGPHRNGRHRIVLRIGYVASTAGDAWEFVHGESTEAAKKAAARGWQARAHDDALRIAKALEWFELHGNDTNPIIEQIVYVGTSAPAVDSVRGVAQVEFEVWTESTE